MLPKTYLPPIKPWKSVDALPRYRKSICQGAAFRHTYRDRHTYIIAMDPESAQVDHKNFSKGAKGRVSISHVELLWCISISSRVWFSVMVLTRTSA